MTHLRPAIIIAARRRRRVRGKGMRLQHSRKLRFHVEEIGSPFYRVRNFNEDAPFHERSEAEAFLGQAGGGHASIIV